MYNLGLTGDVIQLNIQIIYRLHFIFSHPQVSIVSFLFASSCIVRYRDRTGSTSCRTLQVRIPTLSVTFYQHLVFNSCYISPLSTSNKFNTCNIVGTTTTSLPNNSFTFLFGWRRQYDIKKQWHNLMV